MNLNIFDKIRRKAIQFLGILAPVALLTACGGGGSGPDNLVNPPTTTPPTTQVSLAITLASDATTLNGGENTVLTATVTDSTGKAASNQSVAFELGSNLSGATLSSASAITDTTGKASISYTAGGNAGTDSIIATVTDADGRVASASTNIIVTAAQTVVGSVRILSSNISIGTNTAQGVDVIVEVKSSSNVLMPNVPVSLTADQGSLLIASNTTDSSGTITAKLTTAGLYSNGTITLNASAGSVKAPPQVLSVTGTSITLGGQASARSGEVVPYTLTLTDSADKPIANQSVTLSTTAGTLSANSVITNITGQASFTLTATTTATITANALNASNTIALAVSDTSLTFTAPNVDFININTPTAVNVEVKVGGVVTSGVVVSFASTRGTLTAPTAPTNANGIATVNINSPTSGPATLTASYNGTEARKEITFTALTANKIVLQADPSVVSVNTASTLTAIVRDANDNIVANKIVSFNIVTDSSNGKLSNTTAVTDADGRAQVVFTAGNTSTANNGVEIRATADGISTSAFLTVGGTSLYVRIGSDNLLTIDSPNLRKTFSVLVTDSAGAPVEGATLSMRALPASGTETAFMKGKWVAGLLSWSQDITVSCLSEDVDQSGILGGNNVDTNGNGLLDPGNVATFSSSNLVTDSTGFAKVDLIYPMSYGAWVRITLSATAKVAGSEALAQTTFVLPVLVDMVNDPAGSPPSANPSPWGVSASCSDIL